MANRSRKLTIVIGAIVVAALVISVSYYELSKPPVHYGFISMSKASSILKANYTSQTNLSNIKPVQNPFPGSDSYQWFEYMAQNNAHDLVIAEGHYNSTSAASKQYVADLKVLSIFGNASKYNQSFDGFTVSYLNANLTSTPMYEAVFAFAVNGNFTMEMMDPGSVAVTSSSEIPNLIHAQLDAMV